ncbi:MAG: YeeE/YedE family protein [Candidatus Caldarchaeum sp.]|nr:YeeE/YedE family protein [Candidatus Caldarchaeum sp.]
MSSGSSSEKPQLFSGFSALILILAASSIYMVGGYVQHALFMLFGLLYGYAIYRSRLCFATALYGNTELFKGILISLLIASLASYAVIKAGLNTPPSMPVGPHILIGSILFGMTMPFAGGCMTGTLFRFGGGQAKSLFTLIGLLVGNLIGAGFVWRYVEPFVDMGRGISPFAIVGPELSLALNLALITPLLLVLSPGITLRFRGRSGSAQPLSSLVSAPATLARLLKESYWPAWLGGAVMAIVFTAQFALYASLTIQVPLARAVLWLTSPILPSQENPWVARFGLREPYNDPTLLLVMAFAAGAVVASTSSKTFACFAGGRPIDYAVGFLAGVAMGVSVWIAVGCNVSGFWASVATLRPEGWLYAAGMFVGARIGLKMLEKLAGMR